MNESAKSKVKKAIWEKLIASHVKHIEKHDDNICKAYMLVFGQCSNGVWVKLESLEGFKSMERMCDLVGLLMLIQTVMFSYQGQQNRMHALIDAQKSLFSMYQDPTASAQLYP
jgi:hypothetical protein